jgi:hypothetical protein
MRTPGAYLCSRPPVQQPVGDRGPAAIAEKRRKADEGHPHGDVLLAGGDELVAVVEVGREDAVVLPGVHRVFPPALFDGGAQRLVPAVGLDVPVLLHPATVRVGLDGHRPELQGVQTGDLAVTLFGITVEQRNHGLVEVVPLVAEHLVDDISVRHRRHEVRPIGGEEVQVLLGLLHGGRLTRRQRPRLSTGLGGEIRLRILPPWGSGWWRRPWIRLSRTSM